MNAQKTIALFPEASFGAALNCVGIAQELRRMGARPVFICHPGFSGIFADYGFAEYPLSGDDTGGTTEWTDFINRHQHVFRQSAYDQLTSYVGPTWNAIVDTAMHAQEALRQLLARLKPDAVVLDNVIMFPAIANAGIPWIRVVSCAETELRDPAVPPYLSGCGLHARKDCEAFSRQYAKVTASAHKRFTAFLKACGLDAPAAPDFLAPSPWLNLLLAPEIIRYRRARPLDSERFVFLDGCVRREADYRAPRFASHNAGPLVLTSFGSLGAMDVAMIRRMLAVFANLPCRFLVNVGPWRDDYRAVPDNVFVDSWFPQPAVVRQCDLFIHHGGNNSFCEALYFGVPSLVMPYCWDGHDNARRAVDCGVGGSLHRYEWTADELAAAITSLLRDEAMRERLTANALRMQANAGARQAASQILRVASDAVLETPTGMRRGAK